MSIDCGALRHRFAALLRTYVPAAALVFDAEPGDLTDASPVLVVDRGNRARPRLTLRGGQTAVLLYVDCYITVATGDPGYTAADQADARDAVAQQIDTFVDTHQTDSLGGWEAIDQGESSIELGIFNDDGISRFRERVPLTITLFG
ncbi:MAG: hypothetical protein IPK75_17860 [Acidobacteria bacterium]|nr:hypothetical protein [Acidobacteriota bacterium]